MNKDISVEIKELEGPIIVTGAGGFLGASLLNRIYEVRTDVYGFVSKLDYWRLKRFPADKLIIIDFNNANSMIEPLKKISPKTIFNCVSYGAYSFEGNKDLIHQTNHHSIINFTKLLEQIDIKAFIHAGSSSEYGTNCKAPKETDECLPDSEYAVSKLSATNYLINKDVQRKIPAVVLRLYSIYGEYEDSSRLIPSLLMGVKKNKYPDLVDGQISRDFIFIDDVILAFIRSAININSVKGEIINIGTGKKTTIEKLITIFNNTFEKNIEARFGTMPNRNWDQIEWYANNDKASTLLNINSYVTLSQGIKLIFNKTNSITEIDNMEKTKKPTPDNSRKSISAIIACYKDEQAIPIMYQRLTKVFTELGIDYEIIFVNDCSPDESEKQIKDLTGSDEKVIGISHSRNFGSQMAFISGLKHASMESAVLLDGDLQDPPEIIKDFYQEWLKGYDVVYGVRVKREMSYFGEIFYKLFYRIFSYLSEFDIPKDAGDFSLIDRKVVPWILKSQESDIFLRGIRAYVGFKQKGVNYVRPKRMFGTSTNNFFRNIGWAKKGILSFSSFPLTLITISGITLFIISLSVMIIQVLLKIIYPDIAPKGVTMIMLIIIFFGSINLLSIGIIGEYISKIMTEVKSRPRFIPKNIIKNGKIMIFEENDDK